MSTKYRRCIIPNCASYLNKEKYISFHMFPVQAEAKERWVSAIRQQLKNPSWNVVTKNSRICSAHFEAKHIKYLKSRNFLSDNAVPICNIFPTPKLDASPIDKRYDSKPEHVNFIPALQNLPSTSVKIVNEIQTLNEKSSNVYIKNFPFSTPSSALTKSPEAVLKKLKEKYSQKKIEQFRKTLEQRNRRNKKTIESLHQLLAELQEKNLISSDISTLIYSNSSSATELFNQYKTYSPALRSFALTLNFFSPKAYEYVRKAFNLCLPHPRTISRWYMSVNGSPGFTQETFHALKIASDNCLSSGKPNILCSLVIDEIAIRKHLEWDGKMNHGYIELGNDLFHDTTEIAKEALVFMVVAINGSWKLPVAYFLTNSLPGQQKAILVRECITKLEECNVKVISLTFDGANSNIAMAKKLGCDLEEGIEFPYFLETGRIIRIFLDPCHMIKLLRNALSDKKVLLCDNGDLIKWCYIEHLHELPGRERMHLENKIRDRHSHYHKKKIEFFLAAQIFSTPVADALEFCLKELHLPQFLGCEATIVFLRHINKCFDILNSRRLVEFESKKAICNENYKDICNYIDIVIPYIRSIRCESHKIGFQGLIIGLKNVLEIYKEYVVTGPLKYFSTYKISQDHTKVFFSSIQSQFGSNDNPTARQFKTAYKKLLIREEIKESDIGNCIPQEDVSILRCNTAASHINNSSEETIDSKVFVQNGCLEKPVQVKIEEEFFETSIKIEVEEDPLQYPPHSDLEDVKPDIQQLEQTVSSSLNAPEKKSKPINCNNSKRKRLNDNNLKIDCKNCKKYLKSRQMYRKRYYLLSQKYAALLKKFKALQRS